RSDSAADLVARRPANPITLCDGRGVEFVTVNGHIPMTVHRRFREAGRAGKTTADRRRRGRAPGQDRNAARHAHQPRIGGIRRGYWMWMRRMISAWLMPPAPRPMGAMTRCLPRSAILSRSRLSL